MEDLGFFYLCGSGLAGKNCWGGNRFYALDFSKMDAVNLN
jgi:hypothetical protein